MKKSEELKTKRKIGFKCFLLANVLTLFFVVANFSFAADLPAFSAGEPFDSGPFSKLVEFLNDKKEELEKHNGNFWGAKSFLGNNNFNNIKIVNESDFTNSSFLVSVLESVKGAMKNVFDSAKSFIFTGDRQNNFEYTSPSSLPAGQAGEENAKEIETLKQEYEEAIKEANELKQNFALLKNEMGKIKAGGIVVKEPVIEQRTVEKTIEKTISGLSQNDLDYGISSVKSELNNLNTNLTNKINNLSSDTSRQTSAVYNAVSLTNKIDNLSNTTLSNPTVTGTLTNQTLSNSGNATISGTLTAGGTSLSSLTVSGTSGLTGLATIALSTTTNATITDNFWSNGATSIGDTDADILAIRSGVWSLTSTATSTVAMTNGLNFDSNTLVIDPNANRIGLGTSSPYAKFSVVGPVVAEYFHATSTAATSTFGGQLVSGFAPTLAHSFGSWSVGASGANPSGASLIINPSSATSDSNLLSLSVNGSAKFLVDAEGDVFANAVTVVGGTTLSTTTAATFTVENNTVLGDSTTTDITYFNSRIADSLIPTGDNVLDLGDSANWLRWRTGYFGTSVGIGGTATSTGSQLTTSGAYLIDSNNTLSINTANNKAVSFGTGNVSLPYASSTALTISGSAYIGSLNGPLQANNGLVSATTSITHQYGGTGLTSTPSFGQILRGTGSGYALVATSTLGINTSDVIEGSNLFWTNNRFDNRLSATTTLPNLTTLANLATVGTISSGIWGGTTIAVNKGGTGLTSYTLGDVLYASGTGTLAGTSTANLKSTLALNNVENTALSTWAGSTNITTLGTIGTGVWNATTIGISKGGTGATTFTDNRLLTGNGTSALADEANLTFDGSLLTVTGNASTTQIGSTGSAYFATSGGNVGIGTITPVPQSSLTTSGSLSVLGSDANYNAGGNRLVFDTESSGAMWGRIITAAGGGSAISGTNIQNVIYATGGGNVGIGTTTPNWKLSVAGNGSFDDYVRASYFTATSTTATSTFPYLRVLTNSNLGAVVGGTWQGTAIGDAYLTKSGDWTGTLDTYEAANLLARANHTGTQNISTLSNYDLSFSNNYGTNNLTASTTMPWWAQGGINASSTSHFVYATTTALTVSGNSYLGAVSSGAWNGTAVGSQYGGTGLDSSALTGLAQIVAGTWSASSTLSAAYGGTGWNSIAANTVLLGNGAGRLATTSAGTDGYVLGLSAGVPTWLATSTLSTITGTLAVAKGGTGLSSYTAGDVLYASGTGTLAGTSTANLKATLALNNVENTALSTWAGSTNLTTLGTIGTGVWNGTTIGISKGGTGATTFTDNRLLTGNGTSALADEANLTFDGSLLTVTGNASTTQIGSTGSAYFATNAGNVGIGTAAPRAKLEVGNALTNLPTQDWKAIIQQDSNNQYAGGLLVANTRADAQAFIVNFGKVSGGNFTSRFVVETEGNAGIGTTSPWRTLSVAGTVGFDGLTGSTGAGSLCLDSNKQVVYNSGSDACLSSTRATKHDIQNLNLDGLSLISQIQPSSFVYNQGDSRIRYGFMAEDTALVDDRLATHNEKGEITGIDDRAILSVAIKAIQEMNLKISDLQANTSASSGTGSDSLFSWILNKFSSLGVSFGQDRLGAKKGVFDRLEMKDADTGEDYCVKIRNGEWEKTKGTCGETALISSSSSAVSSESSQSSSFGTASSISASSIESSSSVSSDGSSSSAVSAASSSSSIESSSSSLSEISSSSETVSSSSSSESSSPPVSEAILPAGEAGSSSAPAP